MANLKLNFPGYVTEDDSEVQIIDQWIDNIESEIQHHDSGLFRDLYMPEIAAYAYRLISREFEYPYNLEIQFKPTDVILDVGCGSRMKYGDTIGGEPAGYYPVDALAFEYEKLYKKYNSPPPRRPSFALMEALSAFIPESSVDYLICNNALDHCIDIFRSLIEFLKVVKIGGAILLEHLDCEAEHAHYRGLHQWNVTSSDGELIFYNLEKRYNISQILAGFCDISVKRMIDDAGSGRDIIIAKINKTSDIPEHILRGHDISIYLGKVINRSFLKIANANTLYLPLGEKLIPTNEYYVIFGVGTVGRRCLSWFGKKRNQIRYFIDNDSKKWGKNWNGFEVKDPSSFVRDDGIILIASAYYVDEIAAQLIQMGLSSNTDFFVFDEFVKIVSKTL